MRSPRAATADTVCGTVTVLWPSPQGDRDCDGFADGPSPPASPVNGERYYGTNSNPNIFNGTFPYAGCPATPTLDDETDPYYPYTKATPLIPNAWPVDFNDDQLAGLADANSFGSHFGEHVAVNDPDTRWDLDADGVVGLADVTRMGAFFNKRCTSFLPSAPQASTSRVLACVASFEPRNRRSRHKQPESCGRIWTWRSLGAHG